VINFRYHLVSIVAVLLALGIGIVLGSGFLGGVLFEQLQRDVRRVSDANDELRAQIDERDQALTAYEEFARQAETELIGGALAGRDVVTFTKDGTDDATLESLREAVEIAGGSVTATLRLADKLSLVSPEDRNQLASILGTGTRRPNALRRELGDALGGAAAAAASPQPLPRRHGTSPADELEELVGRLVDAEFMGAERQVGEPAVPPLALFLVVEGSPADPPLRPLTFTRALARALAQRGGAVLVAEPSTSTWGVVGSLRADARLAAQVATVDHADTVPGQVAVVLGLGRAARGRFGHYGTGPGAEALMPSPGPLAG
jgi:hypothetical protein